MGIIDSTKSTKFLIIGSIVAGLGIGLFLILPKGKNPSNNDSVSQSTARPAITSQLLNPENNPDAFYINQKYLSRIEKASTNQIKNRSDLNLFNSQYLPYYYQEAANGQLEVFSRSKNGIQRYIFSPDNLTLNLSEQLLDQEKFIPKTNSLPLFQYQDTSGQWQDYQIELPTAITIKNATSIGITLLQKFSLTAKNTASLKVDGEVEFSLGFDGKKYLNKLTFRLTDNQNLNRLIWKNQILNSSSLTDKDGKEKRRQFGDVAINWQDFKGETKAVSQKEEGAYLVYFYETGQKGMMEIDPTVSLSTTATEIIVTQPGRAKWTIQADVLTDLRVPDTDGTNIAFDGAESGYDMFNNNWVQENEDPYGVYWKSDVYDGGMEGTVWDFDLMESSATRVVTHSWWDMATVSPTLFSGVIQTSDWIFTPYTVTQYHHASTTDHDFGSTGYNITLHSETFPGADPEYKITAGSWTNVPINDDTPNMDIDDTYTNVRNDGTSSTQWLGLVNDIDSTFDQDRSGYSDSYGRFLAPIIICWSGGRSDSKTYFILLADDADPNTDLAVINSDYRNPDDLTFTTGTGWYDTDENTSSSADEFNEAENAYCLEASSNQVEFDIDGGTYSRYNPFFKIRSWRSNSEPTTVTLEGAGLSDGTNYNTDPAPFSEAWAYDSGATWKKLADGGDNSDADEYLNDTTNDFDFDQAGYDIFDNVGDYLYLGSHNQFTGVNVSLSTVGSGATNPDLAWQYCSANSVTNSACDTWSSLSVTDTTTGANDFRASGNFYFSDPANWTTATVNSGRILYWIRAYLTSGSYSVDFPVEDSIRPDILLFQYLGNITSNSQTFVIAEATPTPTPTVAPTSPPGPFKFEGVKMEGIKID